MRSFRRTATSVVALALALCALASTARAQQTIINVPSVDQTPRGRWFFLHESQVRAWDINRDAGRREFWATTHFLTYGVTDRFELAATAYNLGTPFKPNAAIGLGWKTAFGIPGLARRAPRWEPKLGLGQMVPISLRSDAFRDSAGLGRRVGLWSYAQAAVRLPGPQTRLMVGVSNGSRNLFKKNTTHAIASWEQPLGILPGRLGDALEHINFLGEWWSGSHDFADFVPGLNYHHHDLVVIVGYKIPNAKQGVGHGLIFEIGTTF
ncbi:MAG: hypothetical protein MUF21_03695 [Gemmatimonadaceae bacterium]|jgi:hypothetical protein|nr:hypothetical protein [Gemmatimonadaceae bacterium]